LKGRSEDFDPRDILAFTKVGEGDADRPIQLPAKITSSNYYNATNILALPKRNGTCSKKKKLYGPKNKQL